MAERRLFTVAETAALIGMVTGEHQATVKQDIFSAMQSDALPVYGQHGKPIVWMSPAHLQRVDMGEVLNALKYHPEVQAGIHAESAYISTGEGDALMPIEQIAGAIARDKWKDVLDVIASEAWELAHAGELAPLLNGVECDSAKRAHLQSETEAELRQALDCFLNGGLLTVRDAVGIPASRIKGAWVLKSDFLKLLSTYTPVPADNCDTYKNGVSDWRQRVRDAATHWCNERQADGKQKPTKTATANEMAVWCRNNDIKTDTGEYPSWEYIRRHVLNRWNHP